MEKSALSDLKDRLLASKSELLTEFKKYDPENTGKAFTHFIYTVNTVYNEFCYIEFRLLRTI